MSTAFLLTSPGVVVAFGCTLGIVPHMAAAIVGLAARFRRSSSPASRTSSISHLAAAVRRHVLARPRVLTWLRRSVAAAFVGLGAKLALAER